MQFQRLLFDISVPLCLKCSSLLRNDSCFCTKCEATFLNKKLNLILSRNLVEIKSYSCVRWYQDESDALSELIYLLKKNFSKAIYSSLLNKLKQDIQKQIIKEVPRQDIILLYIPSSNNSSFSARNMAYVLGQMFEITVLEDTFTFLEKTGQKTLGKKDRQNRKIHFDVKITHKMIDKKLILIIDDVITTGYTMLSAQKSVKDYVDQLQQATQIIGLTFFDRQF